ncbi:hypothetical protein CSV79_06260 [Sporosarcina sp. P13]|uniref:hypothetical protein n=1 Tax=Sporosarcina sp. P13 TaxID=2048263 RepID=UPI000C16EC2C|nr:hypothetical protein [Sporosarcina sp. P13]PIC64556.1 hypothetical protein CSV79_06260 [Sporosarcina sp. P13]
MNKKMALTAIGLGAAYLMRNKESREKLTDQLDAFNDIPMRGDRSHKQQQQQKSNKGLLGRFLN